MEKGKEYHIALGKGDVGRYVLLPGDPGRTPLIAKYFDDAKEIVFNREYRTFTGNITGYDGKKIKISTTSTGIGCPSNQRARDFDFRGQPPISTTLPFVIFTMIGWSNRPISSGGHK